LLKAIDLWDKPLPEESIRRARRAYFGAISYVDDQVGRLLSALKDCYLDEDTVVIFGSDHGDMLGERGLWYKMSWFEDSARVPLLVNYPAQFAPRRVPECVSTMDLLPTLVELVGGKVDASLPLDGRSLYPALIGEKTAGEVIGEYMGEGTISPLVMIRRDRYKYVSSLVDPPQLFDLQADPQELENLAGNPKYALLAHDFAKEVKKRWGLRELHQKVLQSQRQRRVCWDALQRGAFEAWDYQPNDDAAQK
jgi:choline-sulfatase